MCHNRPSQPAHFVLSCARHHAAKADALDRTADRRCSFLLLYRGQYRDFTNGEGPDLSFCALSDLPFSTCWRRISQKHKTRKRSLSFLRHCGVRYGDSNIPQAQLIILRPGFAVTFFAMQWQEATSLLSAFAIQGALAAGLGALICFGLIFGGYRLRLAQGMPVVRHDQ